MKTPSLLARAVLAPVTMASLLSLTIGCNSPGPHPKPNPPAQVDPKDAAPHMKKASSPGPHQHAQRATRRHPAQPGDEPMVGSPGPHPVNGAPTPTPTPGQ